jgi:hypothetical protein
MPVYRICCGTRSGSSAAVAVDWWKIGMIVCKNFKAIDI